MLFSAQVPTPNELDLYRSRWGPYPNTESERQMALIYMDEKI